MNYEALDRTGLYLVSRRPKITSVEPREGKEGDIITLKGSGFSQYVRNNCIVVARVGCAEERSASFEPGRVRIAYLFRALSGRARYRSYAGNDGTRCVPYYYCAR